MAEKRKKQATIHDVARLAGTSVSTVSRYFNNPEIVGEAVGGRIEAAAQNLHWDDCPNPREFYLCRVN